MVDIDPTVGNWWTTVSGAGTADPTHLSSWADDYTRHRSGGMESTYTSTDDKYGRKPIADVNP